VLNQVAPARIRLPSGRQLRVRYARNQAPWAASRLQDFFGLWETPRVAGGQVSLVLHLLAPNQRPVQITTDLASFWQRLYPKVRRELSRRYPKHVWPEQLPQIFGDGCLTLLSNTNNLGHNEHHINTRFNGIT